MSQLFVQVATPAAGAEVPRTCEVTGSISVFAPRGPLVSKSVNVKFGDAGPVVAATFLTATTWRCVGQLDPAQPPGSTVTITVTAEGIIQFPLAPPATGTEEVAATADLAMRIAYPLCPSNLPLVLLPVRLETRFFTLPDNVTELRVRVYPDKIHLDSHEPDLAARRDATGACTTGSRTGAPATTRPRAPPRGDSSPTASAPRAPPGSRALLQPTNAQQRPTAPVPTAQPLPVAPVFPTVTVVTDGKDSAWRHAPQARLMPDRWIAIAAIGRPADPRRRPAATSCGRSRSAPIRKPPPPAPGRTTSCRSIPA